MSKRWQEDWDKSTTIHCPVGKILNNFCEIKNKVLHLQFALVYFSQWPYLVSMWKHWDDTMWKSSGVVQGLTRQQSKSRNGWVGGLSRCSFFLDQKFHSSPFSTRGFTNSAVQALWRVWCDFETFLAFGSNLDYMMFHLVIWRGFSGGWSSFYIHYINI